QDFLLCAIVPPDRRRAAYSISGSCKQTRSGTEWSGSVCWHSPLVVRGGAQLWPPCPVEEKVASFHEGDHEENSTRSRQRWRTRRRHNQYSLAGASALARWLGFRARHRRRPDRGRRDRWHCLLGLRLGPGLWLLRRLRTGLLRRVLRALRLRAELCLFRPG